MKYSRPGRVEQPPETVVIVEPFNEGWSAERKAAHRIERLLEENNKLLRQLLGVVQPAGGGTYNAPGPTATMTRAG